MYAGLPIMSGMWAELWELLSGAKASAISWKSPLAFMGEYFAHVAQAGLELMTLLLPLAKELYHLGMYRHAQPPYNFLKFIL